MFGGMAHSAVDLGKGLWNKIYNGQDPGEGGLFAGTNKYLEQNDYAGASNHIPIMDEIVSQNGGYKNLEVGSGGKWSAFNPNDRKQLEALKNGTMSWRHQGDGTGGQTLADTANGQSNSNKGAPNMFNNEKGGSVQVGVGGVLKIEVTGDSRGIRVPDQVRLTANQQAANQGWSNATPNNPPPGDTPGLNGYDLKYR
jgi:hypothetical protein